MTTERDEAVRVLRAYRGLVSDSKDSPKRTADLNGFDLAIATLTAQRGEVAPLDASMPERIWLQLDTDANNDERDMPFAGDLADLSWCAEQIGGLEVEYVRADLATPPATQQPEAQAVARLVIVDRGGGFKAIRTWDDIGDLPPGEHFLFSAAHPTTPAVGVEDWKARALAAEADIERMADAFNRENGPTFMGEPVLPPEKMVELDSGVRVPIWLLDHARRIELYMKSKLPGPWRIGGVQSHDYKKEIGNESLN